jgi:hypothetical protein
MLDHDYFEALLLRAAGQDSRNGLVPQQECQRCTAAISTRSHEGWPVMGMGAGQTSPVAVKTCADDLSSSNINLKTSRKDSAVTVYSWISGKPDKIQQKATLRYGIFKDQTTFNKVSSVVDPNPKESKYFGWIRIRKKVRIRIQTLL